MISRNIDLHDPPVAFLMVFILSLVASFILFKLLDSRATIRKKGWSAGGAIAGFLIILFGSWHELKPTLNSRKVVRPVSIPSGFKQISASDAGLALAVPKEWEQVDTLMSVMALSPPALSGDIDHLNFMSVQTKTCQDISLYWSDAEMQEVKGAMKKMMGMMAFSGSPVNEPFLGHKATRAPMTMTIPGEMMTPKRDKDLVVNITLREIFDEQNARCIVLFYADTDVGRQINSTLYIGSPEK